MKLLISIGLCVLLLLAVQCKEEEPAEVNQLDLLPAATQSGEHTFGCLVNGRAWVPRSTNDMGAFYQQGVLQVGGHAYGNAQPQRVENSILMALFNKDIDEGQSYEFNDPEAHIVEFSSFGSVGGICEYAREDVLSGSLTITRFDTQRYIVSGRFEFVTVADGCDTIRVTDGRFDLPYTP